MKEIISISILINDTKVRLWIYNSIDNLARSGNAEITLIISDPPYAGRAGGKRHLLSRLIIKKLELADYIVFFRRYNYNRKRRISELKNISSVVDLRQPDSSAGGEDNELTRVLTGKNPDVIVKFGRHRLNRKIMDLPKFGVWGFTIDKRDNRGGLDYGFWEVVNYTPASYSAVQILKDGTAGNECIYESWESTCPFSVNKNRNKLFCRATFFLSRLIEGISLHGEEHLTRLKERVQPGERSALGESREMESLTVMKDIFKSIVRISGLVINKLIYTDAFSWQLLVGISSEKKDFLPDFAGYKGIAPPPGHFWADPFVVAGDGRYYVFVEDFIYRKGKAHISILELDADGRITGHNKVIEKPYHMSYPFIFKYKDEFYMIPETAVNKTVELYRCTDFPGTWRFEKNIFSDISATDTTLFHYGGKWWLFTTIDQTGAISGGSSELFLFYSENPLSESWTSHPLNPVVSDERKARCAGKIFIQDGKIYRPSQDCSMRYGRGLNINLVTKLNEKEYDEVLIREIKPGWDPKLKGVHTFNFDENFTIIDVYKFHHRFKS